MSEILQMNKLVIDTNVLIYALDTDSGFHLPAAKVLMDTTVELFIPTKVISEFFAVTSKLGIPSSEALHFYQEIQNNTTILYPSPDSLAYFQRLVQKYQPRGNKVFDMEIVAISQAHSISQIATANLSDFQEIEEITIFPLVRH